MPLSRSRLLVAALPLLVLAPGAAHAVCEARMEAVVFGMLDVTRGTESTGRVTVDCDRAETVQVGLTGGGGDGHRRLRGPNGAEIRYDLYTDATRTVRWGDGHGSTSAVTVRSDGKRAKTVTIYGVVPRQKPVPPGSYTDEPEVVVMF
jgi:spore coat protein U-like protein